MGPTHVPTGLVVSEELWVTYVLGGGLDLEASNLEATFSKIELFI